MIRTKIKKYLTKNETILLFIVIGVCILIGSIAGKGFFSLENFFDILRSASFVGICSIGFLIVLISGGIDISFTATATITQYVLGVMLVNNHVPLVIILILPVLVGCMLGGINALLINRLKAPAIIITIGTLNLYYGVIQFISNGHWLYGFPSWFQKASRVQIISVATASENTYGLSVFTLLWFLVAGLGFFILRKTVLGRKIYAVGGNADAANRAGVNVGRVKFFCYAFLGGIAAVASIVHAMITQTIAPNAIIGLNFDVLAAVVIGGANIFGGVGSILGTLLGVLLIAILKNGLTIMKVPSYWHQVLIGSILLVSVAITTIRAKKTVHRGAIDVE